MDLSVHLDVVVPPRRLLPCTACSNTKRHELTEAWTSYAERRDGLREYHRADHVQIIYRSRGCLLLRTGRVHVDRHAAPARGQSLRAPGARTPHAADARKQCNLYACGGAVDSWFSSPLCKLCWHRVGYMNLCSVGCGFEQPAKTEHDTTYGLALTVRLTLRSCCNVAVVAWCACAVWSGRGTCHAPVVPMYTD